MLVLFFFLSLLISCCICLFYFNLLFICLFYFNLLFVSLIYFTLICCLFVLFVYFTLICCLFVSAVLSLFYSVSLCFFVSCSLSLNRNQICRLHDKPVSVAYQCLQMLKNPNLRQRRKRRKKARKVECKAFLTPSVVFCCFTLLLVICHRFCVVLLDTLTTFLGWVGDFHLHGC